MSSTITQFPAWRSRQNNGTATLYGVEHAILQTGMRLIINHGRTDEGDPWISVHQDGDPDVLAHIAVIDGTVVADSPAFSKPVRARDIKAVIRSVLSAIRTAAPNRKASGFDVFTAIIIAAAAMHISDADAWHLPLDPEHFPELIAEIAPTQVKALVELITISRQAAETAIAEIQAVFYGESSGDTGEPQFADLTEPGVYDIAVQDEGLVLPLALGTKFDVTKIDVMIAEAGSESDLPAPRTETVARVVAELVAASEDAQPTHEADYEADYKSTIYRVLLEYTDVTIVFSDLKVDFYVGGWEGDIVMMFNDTTVRLIGVEEGGLLPDM